MKKDWIWVIIIFIVIVFVCDRPKDSTDSPTGRSNMGLHIDNLTGCHYLSTLFGGMTPRLDKHGNHMCRGQE